MVNDNLKEFESTEVEATSMDTENNTFSYVKSENEALLDEQDESKDHLKASIQDQKICELCKQICIDGFIPVKDLESGLIVDLTIPDVKFNSLNEPVLCIYCLHSLKTHTHSPKSSSDVQGEISSSSDEREGPCHIKTEQIEIKSEEVLDRITHDCDDESSEGETSQSYRIIQPTPQIYRCDKCDCKIKSKSNWELHRLKHQYIFKLQMYKCYTCNFLTKSKNTLARHQLKHSSEAQMYQCEKCQFKAKYKSHLERHRLVHKDVPEFLMYKCDKCEYKTKLEIYLRNHQRKHKEILASQMYRCDICDYQSIYKYRIQDHQLIHKSFSGEQMYKCGKCSYQTGIKRYLSTHQQIHREIPDGQVYRCDKCSYQSCVKSYYDRHQRRHKEVPSS